MKFMKIVVTLVVMIFLIQQVQKINADPGYLPRLIDTITDGTSAEVK
jgi:hypothetical protein